MAQYNEQYLKRMSDESLVRELETMVVSSLRGLGLTAVDRAQSLRELRAEVRARRLLHGEIAKHMVSNCTVEKLIGGVR